MCNTPEVRALVNQCRRHPTVQVQPKAGSAWEPAELVTYRAIPGAEGCVEFKVTDQYGAHFYVAEDRIEL